MCQSEAVDCFQGWFGYRALRYIFRGVKEKCSLFLWRHELGTTVRQKKTRISDLRDSHKDQPCVLIGGGPSINKLDFSLLSDVVTIACNGFYLKQESSLFTPTYFTVEDVLVAKNGKPYIEKMKGVTKVVPCDLQNIIRGDDVCYVNFSRSYMRPSSRKFPNFSNNFETISYWGGTVMYFNIQLAKYLGCNPIYLVGVDMSYKVPVNSKRYGNVVISHDDDANHFDSRYFGRGVRWSAPDMEVMQKSFSKALLELRKEGVQLLNAGVDSGLLDVPKVDFYKTFGHKQ